MGYSSDSERPAKRYKASQSYERLPTAANSVTPEDILGAPVDSLTATWSSPPIATLTPALWRAIPADEFHYGILPTESQPVWDSSLPQQLPASSVVKHELTPTTAPAFNRIESSQDQASCKTYENLPCSSQDSRFGSFSFSSDGRSPSNSPATVRKYIESPFKDCLDSFDVRFRTRQYSRPNDGCINGYVKVRWSNPNRSSQRPSRPDRPSTDGRDSTWEIPVTGSTMAKIMLDVTAHVPITREFGIGNSVVSRGHDMLSPVKSEFTASVSTTSSLSPETSPKSNGALVAQSRPRKIPPQFGFQAKVEHNMDRKFWAFYINNWCPGRSVLKDTNLWLKDFAQMQENEGVRCAIQCLAGVYVYDYAATPEVRHRIDDLFKVAEARLTELLNYPGPLPTDRANELVTISVILSMQDIVLVERWLERPQEPRWLSGFRHGEKALEATDPGSRFWRANNVQLTSLRISQSIIVGRAVILAQPMFPLPAPETFDPQQEASRFGWLLYGTEKEMYEIHGGCGFSKKLLHVMSQITYCAARMNQQKESPVAPMTAQFLLKELQNMRQWSNDSTNPCEWEVIKTEPQVIEWVRGLGDNYVIDSSADMTTVTAEAWRIAGILYLQCRALRLPRNHPEVMGNLTDLAHCIRVMPTSGTHFTAQAPLFPVFLLAILSTNHHHRDVAASWFHQVVKTPVRSSVPPLFEIVSRIWMWIDGEIPLCQQKISETISARHPWWEKLVQKVRMIEKYTPCLT